MFELPEAKRIRRDEILSPSSSVRGSPEIAPADDEDVRARLGQILGFDTFTPDTSHAGKNATLIEDTHAHDNAADDNDDEQEFEFRLFSAPSKKSTTQKEKSETNAVAPAEEGEDGVKTQKLKIRLRSPTPIDLSYKPPSLEDGRFVVPFRGWSYYFTAPELMHTTSDDQARFLADAEETRNKQRNEFQDVAVTGAQVLHWAQTAETPGCHLPWRVMHLNPGHSKGRAAAGTLPAVTPAAEKKKSKKPGKKRRIILRTRAAAAAAAAATANMTEAEKRNKKNREKKVRKRQRERERKAALAASGDVPGGEDVSSDSSD